MSYKTSQARAKAGRKSARGPKEIHNKNKSRGKPSKSPVPHVGFYGCDRLDRVVRVGQAVKGKRPPAARVACPCGVVHEVKTFMWRPETPGDRFFPPEVLV